MSRSAFELAAAANFSPTPAMTSPTIDLPATPVAPSSHNNPVNLFLHLDKSIYQPQETIWFTGYILNRDEGLMREQNTLYVVIIDPVSRSVVSKQRFLMQNGRGKGSLALPDSISAGDYWFIAYTNALLESGNQPVFRQLISVRTGEPWPFNVSSAKQEEKGDSLFVRYRIGTANSGLAAGAKFAYTLFDSATAIRSGQNFIDPFGEVNLYIGPKQDAGKYRELAVTISRDNLTKRFLFPVNTGKHSDFPAFAEKESANSVGDVKIIPDTTRYTQRSKVTLHIRIRNQAGQPIPGIFSLAVVASRRLGSHQPRSIAWYDQFPQPALPTGNIMKQLAGDMPDYGYVLMDDDKVDKPVNLALMGSNFASFKTDSKGNFALPWSTLVASEGEVNCLSVAAKSPERYKIVVYSRADTFDKLLATTHYPIINPTFEIVDDPEDLVKQASFGMLKAAVVKTTVKSEMDWGSGYYNSTHCEDDYVCTHLHGGPGWPDLLNCPYMVENGVCVKVKPKEGGFYYWTPPTVVHDKVHGVVPVIYHCKVPPVPHFMKVLGPILREKPFPFPFSGRDILGAGLQSTVYWNYGLTTDENGEITVSFYTNDLTGNFTCSLQGVSSAGVIAASASYSVVPPNPIASSTRDQTGIAGGH